MKVSTNSLLKIKSVCCSGQSRKVIATVNTACGPEHLRGEQTLPGGPLLLNPQSAKVKLSCHPIPKTKLTTSQLHPNKLCMVTNSNGLPFDFSELGYLLPRDVPWKNFVDLFVGIQSGNGSWNSTLTKWMDFGWPVV